MGKKIKEDKKAPPDDVVCIFTFDINTFDLIMVNAHY